MKLTNKDNGTHIFTVTLVDDMYSKSFLKNIEMFEIDIKYDLKPDKVFTFDYIKNDTDLEKLKNKFVIEADPIYLWIGKINSNGNITVKFSANITVPNKVRMYLNQTRERRK
jgi:hypothetical protein